MEKKKEDKTTRIIKGDVSIVSADNKQLFNIYLNDVRKYKTLTKEEEINLFKKLKEGDKSVIDTIAKHNLKFVITVAKKYKTSVGSNSMTVEDLVCEGNAGLLSAINSYDYTLGFKFISYAVWDIKRYILAYIGNNIKNVRTSSNRYSLLNKLKRLESDLEQNYGREIDETELLEIAKTKGVFREDYDRVFLTELKNGELYESSLSYPIKNKTATDDILLIDVLENIDNIDIFDTMENKEIGNFINDKLFSELPKHIKKTFEMFFGLNGEKQQEVKYIAEYFDCPPQTVRLRIKNNIWKIRRRCKKDFKKLQIYLD